MKMIATACFGPALAISAFALAGTPASAFEAAAIAVTAPNDVIKDRSEYREHENRELRERAERKASEGGKRCEHARHECRERHGDRGHGFRECVEGRGCGG
jgi:hypothetical protein